MSYQALYRLNNEDIKLLETLSKDLEPSLQYTETIAIPESEILRRRADEMDAQEARVKELKDLIYRINMAGFISTDVPSPQKNTDDDDKGDYLDGPNRGPSH